MYVMAKNGWLEKSIGTPNQKSLKTMPKDGGIENGHILQQQKSNGEQYVKQFNRENVF